MKPAVARGNSEERDRFSAHLDREAQKDFDARRVQFDYPEGCVLFSEEQKAQGVYVIVEGLVKLSVSSSEGKTLNVRVANSGEILGLTPAFGKGTHESTATTVRPTRLLFIRRDDFFDLLRRHPGIYSNVVAQLTLECQAAVGQICNLGLSSSITARLARLLLDWTENESKSERGCRVSLGFTQEQIADFIGTSRETVSRIFGDMKHRNLVRQRGAMLSIPDRAALETYARV